MVIIMIHTLLASIGLLPGGATLEMGHGHVQRCFRNTDASMSAIGPGFQIEQCNRSIRIR